jgi:acyl-CoA oxidase
MTKEIKKQNFKNLDLMHHYTSGMKSVFTQDCYDMLLQIRQCIGGAGYSAWSGIPRLIEDFSPQVTYEGDNTVMGQQSSNFLFKQARKAIRGKDRTKFDGVFGYLSEMETLVQLKCTAKQPGDFICLDKVEECLKVNVSYKVLNILKK